MKGFIADTSVWIDFFNGIDSAESDYLSGAIQKDEPVFICPVILQEILQGFKSDSDFKTAKDHLSCFSMLTADPVSAAIGAAELYRKARKKGLTVRKSNDCLIAWYAITNSIPVFHKDRDFTLISQISKLKIINTGIL